MTIISVCLFFLYGTMRVQTNDFETRCEAIPRGLYFRGTCFVFEATTGHNPSNDLGDACTHLKENGFLALVTGKTLFTMLRMSLYTTWGNGGICWIGLKQFDTSDQPKGGLYWHVPGVGRWEAKQEPITEWKGKPNKNETEYGSLLFQATDQASAIVDKITAGAAYLCQYENGARKDFKEFAVNPQPNSTDIAAEIHGSIGEQLCAIIRSDIPICRSFGYDTNTSQCYAYYIEAEDIAIDENENRIHHLG